MACGSSSSVVTAGSTAWKVGVKKAVKALRANISTYTCHTCVTKGSRQMMAMRTTSAVTRISLRFRRSASSPATGESRTKAVTRSVRANARMPADSCPPSSKASSASPTQVSASPNRLTVCAA